MPPRDHMLFLPHRSALFWRVMRRLRAFRVMRPCRSRPNMDSGESPW